MEITVEQILEAIKKPEIINGLLPQLVEVEAVKKVIENRAEVSYKEKIGEEVKKIHSMYDADMFEILRVKPGQNSDGSAQKTYEKVKEIFTDYKKLSEMKDGLTKDAEVQRLKSELEKVKAEGGGKFIEEQFNKAKEEWTKKEQEFIKQIQDLGKQNTEGMIKTDLTSAFSSLKFNPDFSDTIKNTILATVESKILSSAKVENGKVIYYGADGKPMLNSTTFEPMTAAEVIASTKEIAEITLKEKPGGGGGGASQAGDTAGAGKGGNGTASSITGSSVTYAGGGGGGDDHDSSYGTGTGGTGGGGNGGFGVAGTAGTANTGGGGGGGGQNSGGSGENGAAGGSGIVIIKINQ